MASIFRHIGLDLTTENSDPAKIRNNGGQKQRPKGNFSGLKDSILLCYDSLLPLLDRQEQSASIKGQRQWIVSSDAEPWSDARKAFRSCR